MNKQKFIKLLATGLVIFSIPGCVGYAQNATAQPPKTTSIKIDSKLTSDSFKIIKNTQRVESLIKYLKTRVNKTPYVFAGANAKYGWDCSGLVVWFYSQFGHDLWHSATSEAALGNNVGQYNAKPGDIVAFGYKGYSSYYHAAIYIGNGKVIEANAGAGTTIITSIKKNYPNSRVKYVRLIETN